MARSRRKIKNNQPLILQTFTCNLPMTGWAEDVSWHHWNYLASKSGDFSDIGVTAVWLPPAYKPYNGSNHVGYAVFDKYDLGSKEQMLPGNPDSQVYFPKNTKYGSEAEYLDCIKAFHANDVKVYVDIVMNHMMGGGEKELKVTRVDKENRYVDLETTTMKLYPLYQESRVTDGKPDPVYWDEHNFSGCEHDHEIYRFEGKEWSREVDWERYNYDALMGYNLDMSYPDTRQKLFDWGKWYLDTTGADGVRIDAVKHIDASFIRDWVNEMVEHVKERTGAIAKEQGLSEDKTEKKVRKAAEDFFVVAEYWSDKHEHIDSYYDIVNENYDEKNPGNNVLIRLFDVMLHNAFMKNSEFSEEVPPQRMSEDILMMCNGSLLREHSEGAVTFVDNHDTTELKKENGKTVNGDLYSRVDDRFREQAYAWILFQEKSVPCIYYQDLFDMENLAKMCMVRQLCASGKQHNCEGRTYAADFPEINLVHEHNVIGYARSGDKNKPESSVVVLISNRGKDHPNDNELVKRNMLVRRKHGGMSSAAHKKYVDILHPDNEKVEVNELGYGDFYVLKGKAAVWIPEEAYNKLNTYDCYKQFQ